MDKKNKMEKKADKKVLKEIKKANKNKRKKINEPFLEDIRAIKEKRNKKIVQKLELIVIVFFSIIMLVLLCNRTFFRNNYKTSKINIDIPVLMFFKSDDGNKLVLKTLRKSDYVEDYFNDYLMNFTKYNCNGHTFYYNNNHHYAIYNIDIKKNFIVKTVTITYATGSADCLCNTKEIGQLAEKYCKKA